MECSDVWKAIHAIKAQGIDTKELEDAFTDFECSWEEHVKMFHDEKLHPEDYTE